MEKDQMKKPPLFCWCEINCIKSRKANMHFLRSMEENANC